MTDVDRVQLCQLINPPTPKAIMAEVKRIFSYHYPVKSFSNVHLTYTLTKKLFEGKFPGYKACNTRYHDLAHTLDALLTAARLFDGYNIKKTPLPENLVVDLLISTLLHDTGYIQDNTDNEGTGAKYTTSHVERSVKFLQKNYKALEINPDDIMIYTDMIHCTGLMVRIEAVPFSSDEEKIAGCMLGTADLLGQMSDRAYLEKLLFLYYEFKEAGVKGFDTEFDLVRKTADFYEITKKRLTGSYLSTYIYAQYHFEKRYGVNRNLYIEAIDRHMGYLHKIIEDAATNFRHKLKRGKWVHTYTG